MQKCLLALFAILIISPVMAQPADPGEDPRKEACPEVAKQAGFAYTSKHENGKAFELSKKLRASSLLPIYMWSVDYAQNKATGIDDAVHRAIEKCMNNVELVNQDARRGKQTRIDELQ